jgi:ketosteroid isomerase-like protein
MVAAYTVSRTYRFGGARVAGDTESAVLRELELIEEELAATWKNQDCTGWGALLADDWSVTHLDGQVITKDQAIEMCRIGPPVTSSVDQLAVRSYGDTAIVTGRMKATVGGAAAQTVTLRFTDVFVRHKGRWIGVASHATRLAE